MKRKFFVFLWCLLVAAIFIPDLLPAQSPSYREIAAYAANRWVHFLAYAAMTTIPVALWKRRSAVVLSFLPAVTSVLLQLLHAHFSGALLGSLYVSADMFVSAAGILFGLNLRMMRSSGRATGDAKPAPPRSEFS